VRKYKGKYYIRAEHNQSTCVICGATFTQRSNRQQTCSDACSQEMKHRRERERWKKKTHQGMTDAEWEEHIKQMRTEHLQMARTKRATMPRKPKPVKQTYAGICAVCGEMFITLNKKQKTCSKECGKRYNYARKQRRVAKDKLIDKDITLEALYRRDSGVCYLCGGMCDWNDRDAEHNKCGATYPSIDHVIPLAKGGTHAWDNVRLAHLGCNMAKSDTVIAVESMPRADAYALKRELKPTGAKQVSQYTKGGEWVATFKSTAEAERETGIPSKSIQNCARGECKTVHGFKWSYV